MRIRNLALAGLTIGLLVALCAATYWLASRTVDQLSGRWRIVSVWGRATDRLTQLEFVEGRPIVIDDDGFLLVGRRGMQGLLSQVPFHSRTYYLVQNGNGQEYDVIVGGANMNYINMISRDRNEVIVAVRAR